MRTSLHLAKEVGEELGRSEVLQRTLQKIEGQKFFESLTPLIELLPTAWYAAQLDAH